MQNSIAIIATPATGLWLGTSALAFATPTMGRLYQDSGSQSVAVEQVDYYWNHHHWHHRSWDRHHEHWHYYD
jgi:hypothetical protein